MKPLLVHWPLFSPPPELAKRGPLRQLLDTLIRAGSGARSVKVGDIVEPTAPHAAATLLALPALIVLTPGIGAIPGVPTVAGLVIALVAWQLACGCKGVWTPECVRGLAMPARLLLRGARSGLKVAERVDRMLRPRFSFMTSGAGVRVLGAVCLVLGVLMAPLEFVPLATAVPATLVLLIALGMLAGDGLVMLIAGVLAAAGVSFLAHLIIP